MPGMKKSIIEFIQSLLKSRGLYRGIVDGKAGPKTRAALDKIPSLDPVWPLTRKLTAFIQLACLENGISPLDVDGFWGPATDHAYGQLVYLKAHGRLPDPWRPEERAYHNPNEWPVQYTPAFDGFYGPKGSGLRPIDLPYPHRLSWDKVSIIHSFPCHGKVHPSLTRILSRVVDHYGIEEIRRLRLDLWGGCYDERPVRGGTRWSMHSWGIAVDYDPDNNRLEWGRDRAAFSRPEYCKWWEIWEEEGWVSLGRARNFDWMHVQAARLQP